MTHANKADLFRIPRRFFMDHSERDLDTPRIFKENSKGIWISASDPHVAELLEDAEHYSSEIDIYDFPELFGLVTSAKATVRAIKKHKESRA